MFKQSFQQFLFYFRTKMNIFSEFSTIIFLQEPIQKTIFDTFFYFIIFLILNYKYEVKEQIGYIFH